MALPRKQILDDIKTALLAITTEAGYNNTVATVQIGYEITRNFNLSELPLVIVDPKQDLHERQTFGHATANRFHRSWDIELTGVLRPDSGDTREEGEKLLTDIVKKLSNLHLGPSTAGVEMVMNEIMGPDNFERSEHKVAVVGVNLRLIYFFTPGGL